uniref:Signal transducing adaptor family member 1 n=1 Tax=Otus sunia TaxID=257818 RepID=A0A8C8ATU7_9STRI
EKQKKPGKSPRQIFQERQRISGLPLYLQGYLSVRYSRCQEFRAYWTELRGTTLFFYDEKKISHDVNTETISVCPLFHFVCPLFHFLFNYGVHFQLSVPPDESLLPEQLRRMHEVLEKEKKRIMCNNCPSASLNRKSPPSNTLTTLCFYAVSRQEATEMLEKNPSCGNLILRPGSDSKNYAITIRHELDAPCLKHYKVMSKGTSYVIKLKKQVSNSLVKDS